MGEFSDETSNETETYYPTQEEINEMSAVIWKYGCPVILMLETIGNVLSVLVYTKKAMRQTNLGPQLTLLAVDDLIFLHLSAVPKWLLYVYNVNVRGYGVWTCKLHSWFVNIAACLSPWILIVITIGRLRSVFRPLNTWTDQQTSRLSGPRIIFVLGFTLALVNSHILYGFGNSYSYLSSNNNTLVTFTICNLSHYSLYRYIYRNVILPLTFTVSSYAPFAILVASNVAILMKLDGCGENPHFLRRPNSNPSASGVQARKSLKLILALNVFFIITTTPNTVLLIGESLFSDRQTEIAFHFYVSIARMLLYANSSANFFFYLVTKQFRTELLAMFGREGRQPRKTTTTTRC